MHNSVFTNVCLSFFLDIYGGYLCFVISIFCIGVVTAVIGDVASHFGCTLGIKDTVTAICFVALGTSVPGRCNSAVVFLTVCKFIHSSFLPNRHLCK